MSSLSKESVMAAIKEPKPQPKPANSLAAVRKHLGGGDSSVAAYKAYAMEAMEKGEAPMSLQEFQKQKMPKNSLLR